MPLRAILARAVLKMTVTNGIVGAETPPHRLRVLAQFHRALDIGNGPGEVVVPECVLTSTA